MCLKNLLIGLGLADSKRTEASVNSATAVIDVLDTPSDTQGNRFKTLGTLVVAVKRFQESLNPKVDYASVKRPSSKESYDPPLADARAVSAPPSSFRTLSSTYGSWRAVTGAPQRATMSHRRSHTHRGHITSYVFKSLQFDEDTPMED